MCEAVTDAVGRCPARSPHTCPSASMPTGQFLTAVPATPTGPLSLATGCAKPECLGTNTSLQGAFSGGVRNGRNWGVNIQVPPLSWMDPSALPAPCPQQQLTLCQSLHALSLHLASSTPGKRSLGSGLKQTTHNSSPNFRVCFSDQFSLRHKDMAGVISFSLGNNPEKQVSRPHSTECKVQKVGDPCQRSHSQ